MGPRGNVDLKDGNDDFSLTAHTMKCSNDDTDNFRSEILFWEIESLNKNEEESVVNEFERHIYHDRDRYVTRLPFKSDHILCLIIFQFVKGDCIPRDLGYRKKEF